MTEITYSGQPAVRIPYFGENGTEAAVQFRVSMTGDRFRWKRGHKPILYGLKCLPDARHCKAVFVVEGPSDAQTLWFHGYVALGLPSASGWNEERDAHVFDGIHRIYAVIEPDMGGEAVREKLGKSAIRDRVFLVSLAPYEDVNDLHIHTRSDEFDAKLGQACEEAIPWSEMDRRARRKKRAGAWRKCSGLAMSQNILDRVADTVRKLGVVGEDKLVKLIFLVLVTRFLARPVILAVKGLSSAGKSFVVENTLKLFPPSAYYALTAMPERALVYSDKPLSHRILILYESAGINSAFASYLLRSLLSEGCLRYETVEEVGGKRQARLIEREGPTGLITTTTKIRLHPENETRLLSVTVTDTPAQTQAVMLALAGTGRPPKVDLGEWTALQEWLEFADHETVIPFAAEIAKRIPPVAVRLRRDFKVILSLIQAHAILHQAKRKRDGQGRIIAELEDYSEVQKLVADLIAEGVEAKVPMEVKQVLEAVKALSAESGFGVSISELAQHLKLDKATISRRVRRALEMGWLQNEQQNRGVKYRLVLGDPVQDDSQLLPSAESLGASKRYGKTDISLVQKLYQQALIYEAEGIDG